MEIKLLAVDMDGTLLRNKHEIAPAVKMAVRQTIEKGVKVVIATGRIYPSAKFYANMLETKSAVISCNGAEIREYESNDLIGMYPLKADALKTVIDVFSEYKVSYQMYGNNVYYTTKMSELLQKYVDWNKNQRDEDKIIINFIEDPYEILKIGVPIYKVLLYQDSHRLSQFDEIIDRINRIPHIHSVRSMTDSVDIVDSSVNKGNALKTISEYYKIPMGNILAIGDNDNDKEMIKLAGIGVAMGNAEKEIKEIADYVTSSNLEDGVAEAIQKFIL
ncbi:MAG: HAD family phosphatase [Eubacteriaceae bacterium]|nr:HAD family phosphatase [Eubacteriaceae bacterium]